MLTAGATPMSVLFRDDVNTAIGLGHGTRCLTLMQVLPRRGHRNNFCGQGIFENEVRLDRMSSPGMWLVDGRGRERVVDVMELGSKIYRDQSSIQDTERYARC